MDGRTDRVMVRGPLDRTAPLCGGEWMTYVRQHLVQAVVFLQTIFPGQADGAVGLVDSTQAFEIIGTLGQSHQVVQGGRALSGVIKTAGTMEGDDHRHDGV